MAGQYDPNRYNQYAPSSMHSMPSPDAWSASGRAGRPDLAPGVDVGGILESSPDAIPAALAKLGAMNTKPPVTHSSHLKNKDTGLVLPWNSLIAEQRDIMVPCDRYGNTDPAAWEATVVADEDPKEEQERLYWAARKSVVEQAMQMSEGYRRDFTKGDVPQATNSIPENTVPFAELDTPVPEPRAFAPVPEAKPAPTPKPAPVPEAAGDGFDPVGDVESLIGLLGD